MSLIHQDSSIADVERLYQQGLASEAEVVSYLREWNQGPHFTQAVLQDGAIRNFDPETSSGFYRHLREKFALRLPEVIHAESQ